MPEELPEFDAPIFKRLANNDTGQAVGHQGGVVIPKDLDAYFPQLPAATPAMPAPDRYVQAILVVPGVGQQTVTTRYQHQTWGMTRLPERRLTDNLTFLRNAAQQDDFLIIERGVQNRDLFRLTLIDSAHPDYAGLVAQVGTQRWGLLDPATPPVTDSDVEIAEQEQKQHEADPLSLFDNAAVVTETRVKKVSRGKAFQKRVAEIYDNKCAVCGSGLVHPVKGAEVESAHIVPRGKKGADDARNGLALCRAHHWAFDKGMFYVQAPNVIQVLPDVSAMLMNSSLAGYHGKTLRPPTDPKLAPAPEALKWHRDYIVA
jgi:putative restriction endonuclease